MAWTSANPSVQPVPLAPRPCPLPARRAEIEECLAPPLAERTGQVVWAWPCAALPLSARMHSRRMLVASWSSLSRLHLSFRFSGRRASQLVGSSCARRCPANAYDCTTLTPPSELRMAYPTLGRISLLLQTDAPPCASPTRPSTHGALACNGSDPPGWLCCQGPPLRSPLRAKRCPGVQYQACETAGKGRKGEGEGEEKGWRRGWEQQPERLDASSARTRLRGGRTAARPHRSGRLMSRPTSRALTSITIAQPIKITSCPPLPAHARPLTHTC